MCVDALHVLIRRCALEGHRKKPKCYVCGEKTGGVFAPAKEILAKMEKTVEVARNTE